MEEAIFISKKYVTNAMFIKKAIELKLSLEEFLMITYFDNHYDGYLNIEEVSGNLGIPIDNAYKIFNSLLLKKLISIETAKDKEGRMIEKISLNNFYKLICEEKKEEVEDLVKTDIYSKFELEFGRTITSMEYEIINAWLEKNYSEEIIVGALKEAVYNGVKNLRYIDKILYEWGKKGFKNMNDVNNHLQNKEPKKNLKEELFDYNWLEDEE